jgi:hypothetical protein
MPKALTMLEIDNLKDRNEKSFETRPLTKQECRNLIRTIEAKQEDIDRLNEEMDQAKELFLHYHETYCGAEYCDEGCKVTDCKFRDIGTCLTNR